ncbi:hypothetical protein LRS74_15745 [Streptomyces sp. LX-29]|uniref:SCO3933 family regulatory protein n=1 Tax=Streptomyces sp. LX-29 TaxID=2900152 RepID=UPI00240E7478|nr:hypothetical protein [Streptomyces sp. LX-29]WFB08345.1 hypothetical protein LRS74_15745 [Streptomyces sp. LX-29]
MAMTRIRVGLLPSTQFIVGTLPVPKVKDPETGELATDRETGETLFTLTVFLMEEGRAEQMKITVPQSGLVDGLRQGLPVRLMELFALPWARIFNGQLSDGVAYRVSRLELAGLPQAPEVSESAA